MRGCVLLSIAAVLVMLVVTSAPAAGQGGRGGRGGGGGEAPAPAGPIPRTPDGTPDLTGSWSERMNLTHTVILEEHSGGFGVTAKDALNLRLNGQICLYRIYILL